MSTVSKTVKAETKSIPKEYSVEIENMYDRYGRCLNMFYEQYDGINSMVKIQSFQTLRNELRQHMIEHNYDLAERFHFSNRHWVMALSQCCSNLKSLWTNLGNRIKKKISNRDDLNEDEKHYIRYIVSSPKLWQAVLTHKTITPSKGLAKITVDEARKPHLHRLICRLTRKFKFKRPKAENLTCMLLDQEMYSICDKGGKTYVAITGLTKGKRMVFELKSPYHYKKNGDIQLIYDREKSILKIHKCIQTKVKQKAVNNKKSLGIDKGYATILSCSNDKEYGECFGDKTTKHAEYLNRNGKAKNQYRDYVQKLKEKLDSVTNSDERRIILRKIYNVEKCNLGKKTFDKKHQKFQAYTEQMINKSIKDALADTDAAIIAIEDLSFESPMGPAKDKAFNRKMSLWNKGVLDERLEYVPSLHGIGVEKVNAAYTSQFCACCGAPITERKGKHNEIAVCPNCGEVNANTNAAKNIQARLNDKEITLYTPHKKIKAILLERYQKRIEEQSKSNDKSTQSNKSTKSKTKSKTLSSKSEKVA